MRRGSVTGRRPRGADRAKRRSTGEGGAYRYQIRAGERWRFKCVVAKLDGTRETINRRGFETKAAALKALREAQSASDKQAFVEPSKRQFGEYGEEVIEGLRLKAQTRASYKKNWRLHVSAYPIAAVPLAQLTGQRLTTHFRLLEKSRRKDHKAGEGLSARTVRYIHTTIHGVLGHAVRDGLLLRNPADAATPPTAREAKAPEMHPWAEEQLALFLDWAAEHSQHHALWYTLAYTGMRRGEALSLRWRDVDLERAAVAVRRTFARLIREARTV
jgi:integrase